MKTWYSIGEFSQVTGLSVKTLRFYHEKGILVPSSVDEATGYRSYDAGKIEKARIIMRLRAMEFSIEDIATVLRECDDEMDILNHLERQKNTLQQRIREDRDIVRSLDEIIAKERAAQRLLEGGSFNVEEKTVEPLLVAGLRMKGRYGDCGTGFSQLGKAVGRYICGKPLCLYYDGEYRDDDADFEPCFPIRKNVTMDGVSIRTLPGGRCLTLIHRGPYDQLGRSYAKILRQTGEQKWQIVLPTREVYVKGPGVIFGASVCLFPLKSDSEHLFEILMGFVLTTCTVALTILYFRRVNAGFPGEGCLLGLAFVACNLLFDLPMFSAGPMKMPLLQYLKEIGLAYLSMPIISIGFGYALQARTSREGQI